MSHHHHHHNGTETAERVVLWVLFGLTVVLFLGAFVMCACCYVYKKAFKWIAYIGTFVAGAIMLYQLTLALTAQLDSSSSSSWSGEEEASSSLSSLLRTKRAEFF